MPLAALTLRSIKGSALTYQEVDANWTILRDGLNATMQLFSIALQPDGTLKPNSVNTAAIVDGAVTAAKLAAGAVISQTLFAWHNPGSGAAGGTFNSGAWRTRTLNNSVINIAGASVGSNQITLPAGTFRLTAHAVGHKCDGHQCIIRNISGDAVSLDGTTAFSGAADDVNTLSRVEGRFTLAAGSVIEIQSRCQTSQATDGFGKAVNVGTSEVYAHVFIEKEQ